MLFSEQNSLTVKELKERLKDVPDYAELQFICTNEYGQKYSPTLSAYCQDYISGHTFTIHVQIFKNPVSE